MSKYSLTTLTRKEKILDIALELFANEGFDAVSTQSIAHQADVSEGLIFRHFKSKKALLEKILAKAESKIQSIFKDILEDTDPCRIIRNAINVAFLVEESEYDFWRLQFKLKWEAEYFDPEKMKVVEDKLCWAFEQLGYEDPGLEADLLLKIIDSTAIAILQDSLESQQRLRKFLIKKYKVNEY